MVKLHLSILGGSLILCQIVLGCLKFLTDVFQMRFDLLNIFSRDFFSSREVSMVGFLTFVK